MYTERLPWASGESAPNMSCISARLVSRLMEWVAPMASRFKPSIRAMGIARKMVQRLPNSWSSKAGPAEMTMEMLAPALMPSLATKGRIATPTRPEAALTFLSSRIFSTLGPVRIPRNRA